MHEKVFELFVQLDGAVGNSDGGMGVGLTLVRALVGLHGGTVTVNSDGGGSGSEFVVRLPAAKGPHRMDLPQAPASALAGVRVLVVDDNEDIRSTTTRTAETRRVRCGRRRGWSPWDRGHRARRPGE